MKTIVFQSYRQSEIPKWIGRCLDSVKQWARLTGHEYELCGDDKLFEAVGGEFLSSVGRNFRSITNLGRLEFIRSALAQGYDRAIWLDADVFVFAPDRLDIKIQERYAFAREVWISDAAPGQTVEEHGVNNAACIFAKNEPDLDFLIDVIRYIAKRRNITSNYQVGGDLLKGLRKSLAFNLLDQVGMFSPMVVRALHAGDSSVLRRQALAFGTPVYAANICATSNHGIFDEAFISRALNSLEETMGAIVNSYLPEGGSEFQEPPFETRHLIQGTLESNGSPLRLPELMKLVATTSWLQDQLAQRSNN
jgi:hypothetical protein